MPRYVPKYVSPKQTKENRARLRSRLFWIAIAIPCVFLLLAFGYSDQAPAFLRSMTIEVDRAFGHPILWLISAIASR